MENKKQARGEAPGWEKPTLVFDAHLNEIVRGGGAKLSAVTGDPGDIGKPPGQE